MCTHRRVHLSHEVTHLRRVRVAAGVSEADLVATGLHQGFGQGDHTRGRYMALEGAAERGGETALEPRPSLRRQRSDHRSDGTGLLQHLCMRTTHVLEAVGLGHRQGQRDLVRARLHRRLGAAQVGHQRRHDEAGDRARMAHHQSGVRQLRQELRRDEAAHLDLGDTRCGLGVDPGFLSFERHDGRDALQSVARPDFADQNGHEAWSIAARSG